MLLDDRVILTVDNTVLQGAVLEVEYNITLSRYAYYGTGSIFESKITDKRNTDNSNGDRLVFRSDGRLITENKTNGSYGWSEDENGDIITISNDGESKLVLSKVLSAEDMSERVYKNEANAAIRFDNGTPEGQYYSGLRSKAPDVVIIPPFGGNMEEKTNKNEKIINFMQLKRGVEYGCFNLYREIKNFNFGR